jgi:3-hydroxypropanoate dehydrogenase
MARQAGERRPSSPVYDAMKYGPTSANGSPARFVFLRSKKAKERLRPALAPGNVEKTMAAPITVIIAYDLRFYEKLPNLFPESVDAHALRRKPATRRGDRPAQLVAAGRLSDGGGPCAGSGLWSHVWIDNAKLDEEFFGAGKDCEGCDQEFFPEGHVKSNFLCNLGYGDRSTLSPRNPRLEFNEACTLM